MNIYIVRHGDAEPAMAGADKDRALTKEGIESTNKAYQAAIVNVKSYRDEVKRDLIKLI